MLHNLSGKTASPGNTLRAASSLQVQQYRGRNREGMLLRPDLKDGTALSALSTHLSLRNKAGFALTFNRETIAEAHPLLRNEIIRHNHSKYFEKATLT